MNDRPPVVVLPGLLGSRLGVTGEPGLVWGDVRSFYFPKGRGVHLRDRADLEPRGVLETVPVVPRIFEIAVYSDLLRHLRQDGWDVHPFGYDFRKTTVALMTDLAGHIEEVGKTTGAPEVALVGHSHGGIIASGLARAGASVMRVKIRAVIALAAAFRGSLDNLRMMVNGYRVAPLAFHYDAPFHVLAHSPAETLPPPGVPCFEDERGNPLDVDIYDMGAWMRHELGIFSPAIRGGMSDRSFGYLVRQLEAGLARGADLHRAFAGGLPPGTPDHRVIAGVGQATRRRAVLTRTSGGWRADFGHGTTVPGDGEVELESATACGARVREVPGTHRDLINRADTWRAVSAELASL